MVPSRERSTLILVPTALELTKIQSHLGLNPDTLIHQNTNGHACRFELIGFGPIVAAARTMELLFRWKPEQVVLIGIAGLYDSPASRTLGLNVGQAIEFETVSCYGIGAGSGANFQSAETMGWKQWPAPASSAIGSTLDLVPVPVPAPVPVPFRSMAAQSPSHGESVQPELQAANRSLLTVCSAAANQAEVEQRLQQFPDSMGEDMEAFGVATACRLRHIPCSVIRGFSNQAGNRNHQTWKIDHALAAASELLKPMLFD